MTDRPRDGAPSLEEGLEEEARAERQDTMSGPDSPEGRELARAVGGNVSRLRMERGLDLAALAVKSGIALERVSAFEAGQAVPSLRAIWHLATALAVPFGALLRDTMFSQSLSDFQVRRAGRGRVIQSANDEFRSRVLFVEGDPRTPEVYELTLAPGCREEATAHAPDTYEHIVVVTGVLVVYSGEDRARLDAGDSIFFRADRPHGYENPGASKTVAHLVMTYSPS